MTHALNVLLLCHFSLLAFRHPFPRLRKAPILTGLALVILWLSERHWQCCFASLVFWESLRFLSGVCLGCLLLLITTRVGGLRYHFKLGNIPSVLVQWPLIFFLTASVLAEEIIWRGIVMYKAIETLGHLSGSSHFRLFLTTLGIVLTNLFFAAAHSFNGRTVRQVVELLGYFCLMSFVVYFSASLTIGVAMHLARNLMIAATQSDYPGWRIGREEV